MMENMAFTYPDIQGDWLEDHGIDRGLANPPLGYPIFYRYTYGYGYGYGYGDGDGYGYGYGPGPGYGPGNGYGYGYGDGDGYGYGYGDGDGYTQPKEKNMPIVGQRMLIFCGLSFAFVADVVAQLGPYQFQLDNCSMLCRTGSVPWDDLADGKRRTEATYRWQGNGVSVGPFFSWARPWNGKLPGKNHKADEIN